MRKIELILMHYKMIDNAMLLMGKWKVCVSRDHYMPAGRVADSVLSPLSSSA